MTDAYVALYFCKYGGPGFVYNGVYFFDYVEVGFVVGVFDASASPRNVGKLTGWQHFAHT